MGQNNRARRAAKTKARQQRERTDRPQNRPRPEQQQQQHAWGSGRPPADPEFERTLIDAAVVEAAISGYLTSVMNPSTRQVANSHWETLEEPQVRRLVQQQLWQSLQAALRGLWATGWLPLDVDRMVARHPHLGKRLGSLPQLIVHDLIADELAGYAPATIDQRIHAQVAELGATVWWPADQSPLAARATTGESEVVPWRRTLTTVMLLLTILRGAGVLPTVCPPPGQAIPTRRSDAPLVEDRILQRVRQLLAKAESTTFDAEAETFTAGAQALMARHSIDLAMLAAAAPGQGDGPQQTRLYLYAPYEDAKSQLLDAIAQANRCKVVMVTDLGCACVVGFGSDLLAVEALFTSLLVQATSAMQRLGSRQDRYGRSRTRSFRSSFLVSFAARIGERLISVTQEETSKATAEADGRGQNLLPVLAARDEQVAEHFEHLFPQVVHRASRRSYDAEGWHAGRRAADRAELQYGGQVSR